MGNARQVAHASVIMVGLLPTMVRRVLSVVKASTYQPGDVKVSLHFLSKLPNKP